MRRALPALFVGLLAATLVGCGLRSDGSTGSGAELTAALTPEAAALTAFGFAPEEVATDDPVATAEPEPESGQRWQAWRRRHAVRVLRNGHLLHGEVVVQTASGARTVLVQRGEVTATSATTVTVTSSDGFVQSWTYGDPLRVLEARTTIEPRELAVGTTLGVAGARAGGEPTARLVVIAGS